MDEQGWMAEQFEANRTHLRSVAYRMLGSRSEADDAVQEAWLRLSRSSTKGVENVRGWLTTAVGRICLDMLRSRRARREEPLGEQGAGRTMSDEEVIDPQDEILLADSVGLAMLVVLERLAPAERVAFVLHDIFDLPFDDIAPIVGRSPTAARQLASRARRRVQGAPVPDSGLARRREVVEAFLAAARAGQFEGLLAVLDPDIVLRADRSAVQMGAASEVRGAAAVIDNFAGRARGAQLALVNGAAGAVWAPGGRLRVVFNFAIRHGRIVEIDLVADPKRLRQLDLVMLCS
jgi:RNA polymerase sigma-70 factor (ECF subfamily)